MDGLRFMVTANRQTFVVDAAQEEGGTGTGMNSRQLFADSMAACVLSFLANSMRLSELPLQQLSLELGYAEAQRPQRVSRLELPICVQPPVPAEQRKALLGLAQQSIVLNTLRHPPEILISLE